MYKNFWHKARSFLYDNAIQITMFLALFMSIGSLVFVYFHGHLNLAYFDAQAHLDLSRKLFDNLTPGLTQLGNLWLPLTHILMAPFVQNNFLWHSGIAGAIVSMSAFLLSVYFVFKTIELLWHDRGSAFIGALVYLTSVNIVYMQTMALMDPLFHMTVIGTVYFISRWIKTESLPNLMIGALFVVLSTLTRYEGYAVFGVSCFVVFITLFVKSEKRSNRFHYIEGNMLAFVVLAALGIFLWALYLFAIFGDAFYWMHSTRDIEQTFTSLTSGSQMLEVVKVEYTFYESIVNTVSQLWSATALANGFLTSILGILGIIALIVRSVKKRDVLQIMPIFLMSAPMLFFIILIFFGELTLTAPSFYGNAFMDRSLNMAKEGGLRYALIALPLFALAIGFLSVGSFYKKFLVGCILIIQFVLVFFGPFFLTYNLALKWSDIYISNSPSITWLQEHYDGGLILISSINHESTMFQIGIDYKNYIHEGTGKYWKESLENPEKYATWIIMNKTVSQSLDSGVWGNDMVTAKLSASQSLLNNFNLIYEDNSLLIYKINNR